MKFPRPHQVLPRRAQYVFESSGPLRIIDTTGSILFEATSGLVSLMLPKGGPYKLEMGKETVFPIWSGDLWVLAGQSNMEGAGIIEEEIDGPAKGICNFALDDQWFPAQDPLHERKYAIDPCQNANPSPREELVGSPESPRNGGVGPGLAFAKEIFATIGIPIGLIPCAHGGTSMAQWNPELKKMGGGSLYGALLRRIGEVGGGASISGVLWYQGESDRHPENYPHYENRTKLLILSLRIDVARPDLAFYFAQLSRHITMEYEAGSNLHPWNALQLAQTRIARDVPDVFCAATIDLDMQDHIHINAPSQRRLGKRLAHLALGRSQGPSFKDVEPFHTPGILRIRFSGVVGALAQRSGAPGSRILGFSFRDAIGQDMGGIYHAYLDPAEPDSVFLKYTGDIFGYRLWYGYGSNPTCFLVDGLDMAMPICGPIEMPKAFTGGLTPPAPSETIFFQTYRVSDRYGVVVQEEEPDFAAVYPPETDPASHSCVWTEAEASKSSWPQGQGLLWISDRERDGKTGVYYLWSKMNSGTRRKARLWFGFGGKSKLWWNGGHIGGINTASGSTDRNQGSADVVLERGENILLVKATSFSAMGARWIGTVRMHPLTEEDVVNAV